MIIHLNKVYRILLSGLFVTCACTRRRVQNYKATITGKLASNFASYGYGKVQMIKIDAFSLYSVTLILYIKRTDIKITECVWCAGM